MAMSHKIRLILISLLLFVTAGILAVWISLPHMEVWAVGFHQRSVARSLVAWAPKCTNINIDASAVHAAEIIEYMRTYYVPGDGY